jgi:hypothetical protein
MRKHLAVTYITSDNKPKPYKRKKYMVKSTPRSTTACLMSCALQLPDWDATLPLPAATESWGPRHDRSGDDGSVCLLSVCQFARTRVL